MRVKKILALFLLLLLGIPLFSDFVVIGDVRMILGDPYRRQPNPDFLRNIQEINLMGPEAVFIIGDLIYGYDNRREVLEEEWRNFLKAASLFKMPYYLIPGNHEIFASPLGKELYEKHAGPTYWARVVNGKLFIALSTEEFGYEESLSPAEIKFLRKTLRKFQKIRKKYVLMHRPLWWPYEDHALWMSKIHPLLKKYGVKAVFAGHYHEYEYREVDGIKYIVTGGGGAESSREEFNGSFPHFLYIKEGKNADRYIVMGSRGIFPADFVTPEKKERLEKFLHETSPEIEPGKDSSGYVVFKNTFGKALRFLFKSQVAGKYFTAAPEKVEFFLLSGESLKIPLVLRFRAKEIREVFPFPQWEITARDEEEGLFLKRQVEYKIKGLRFVDQIKLGQPVKYSGRLPEIYNRELSKDFLQEISSTLDEKGKTIRSGFNHVFDIEREVFPNMKVYAFAKVVLKEEAPSKRTMAAETTERFRLFLNGKEIYKVKERGRYHFVSLPLKKGSNDVIFLLTNPGGGWTIRIALK